MHSDTSVSMPPFGWTDFIQGATLFGLCLVMFVAASIGSEHLKVPPAERVVSIDVNDGTVTISDPAKVAEVIAEINLLNNGMAHPLDIFPTSTHSLVITDKDHVNLVILVGPNWIGGRNDYAGHAGAKRLRGVTDKERIAFLRKLGIT